MGLNSSYKSQQNSRKFQEKKGQFIQTPIRIGNVLQNIFFSIKLLCLTCHVPDVYHYNKSTCMRVLFHSPVADTYIRHGMAKLIEFPLICDDVGWEWPFLQDKNISNKHIYQLNRDL